MDIAASRPRPTVSMLVVLGALSAFGPLSMDLYLPSLPSLIGELHTAPALAQLTLSACMVGLACGQLVAGPISDRMGRRRPLLVGVSLFTVASILCALAPTIQVLLVLRLLQGLGGSAGIVLGRAVIRDHYEGVGSARVFSRLQVITGVAPVLAPVIGGALLLVVSWRGLFVVLAAIGLVLVIATAVTLKESLAPENHQGSGVAEYGRMLRRLLGNRRYLAYVLVVGFGVGSLFSYISMSPLVLQRNEGLTPQLFAVVFAVNAVGITLVARLNGALLGRLAPRRLLRGALLIGVGATSLVLVVGRMDAPLFVVLIPLFIAVSMQGAILPNATALALAPFGKGAGFAAALVGTAQFLIGALIGPAVSVGGVSAALMGGTMLCCMLLALVALLVVGRGAS